MPNTTPPSEPSKPIQPQGVDYVLNILWASITGFWQGEGDFPSDEELDKYDTVDKAKAKLNALMRENEIKLLKALIVLEANQVGLGEIRANLEDLLEERTKTLTGSRNDEPKPNKRKK